MPAQTLISGPAALPLLKAYPSGPIEIHYKSAFNVPFPNLTAACIRFQGLHRRVQNETPTLTRVTDTHLKLFFTDEQVTTLVEPETLFFVDFALDSKEKVMLQPVQFSVEAYGADRDPSDVLINVNGNQFIVIVDTTGNGLGQSYTVGTFADLLSVQANLPTGSFADVTVVADENDPDSGNPGVYHANKYSVTSTDIRRYAFI